MSKDAIEGNLIQVIRNMQRRISALERQQNDVGQLSELSSDMGLQTAGEFRAGNGVEPGEGFSGVRMTADGVSGYDNDVLQSSMSATDGKITAGGGDVVLNSNGIVVIGDSAEETGMYKLKTSAGVLLGHITAYDDGSWVTLDLVQDSKTARDGIVEIMANSPSGKYAQIQIAANAGGEDSAIVYITDDGTYSTMTLGEESGRQFKLKLYDTGAITGGSESLADDTVVSFKPVIDRGLIIVYVGAADEQAMVIYNTSTPGTWGMLLGANMVITTGALTNGTTDGTDAKWNISCHTDGKIYIKNRTGSTKIVRWNLLGGT